MIWFASVVSYLAVGLVIVRFIPPRRYDDAGMMAFFWPIYLYAFCAESLAIHGIQRREEP